MPRKKQVEQDNEYGYEVPSATEAIDASYDVAQDQKDREEIEALVEELGGTNAKVTIFRMPPSEDKYVWCNRWAVDQFSMEKMVTEFGGGDYKLRFTDSKGKFRKEHKLSIDPRIKGKLDRKEGENGDGGWPRAMQEMMSQISSKLDRPSPEDNGKNDELLVKMLENQKHESQQTMQLMMTMMQTMMTSMVELMKSQNTGKGGTDSELLSAIQPVLVKSLESQGSGNMEGMLKTFREIKELMEGSKDDDDMLGKLTKLAGPLLNGFMGGAGQAQQTRQLSQGGQSDQAGQSEVQNKAAHFYEILYQAAQRDLEVETYGNLFLDSINEEQLEQIVPVLRSDQWYEQLFGAGSRFDGYKNWCQRLKDYILECYDSAKQDSEREGDGGPSDQSPGVGEAPDGGGHAPRATGSAST